jgi:hypothetical protein
MSYEELDPTLVKQEAADIKSGANLDLTADYETLSVLPTQGADVIDLDLVRARIAELTDTRVDDLEVSQAVEPEATDSVILPFERPDTIEAQPSKPIFIPRPARLSDISDMVEIDLISFEPVYRNEELSIEEKRAQLTEIFNGRFEKLGGDWMQVVVNDNGKICGFIVCCPTSKKPEDFESWEATTDNGTLDTTYDPTGENIYVVSLSMLPEGSNHNAQDILFANQIGKMIELGYKTGYFESRLPGLRSWVKKQAKASNRTVESFSDEEKLDYAVQYVSLRKVVDGKEVLHDRLLRIFSDVGAKFVKVVPDAYQDVPSMNFGVVCVLENPLPKWVQRSRTASKVIGKAIRFATKHPALMKRLP